MTQGDSNTRHFHNTVKVHQHKNRVRELKDISGNIFSNQIDIEKCFLNFFKNLWYTTVVQTPDFYFNALPDNLPTLLDMDREFLTRPFSKDED